MNVPTTIAAVVGVCIGFVASIACRPQVMSDQTSPEYASFAASNDSKDADEGARVRHSKRLELEAEANRKARQQFLSVSVRATDTTRSQTTTEPGWSRLVAATPTPPTTALDKAVGESAETTRATMKVWDSISTTALGVLGKAADAITAIAGAKSDSLSKDENTEEGNAKPQRKDRTSGRMKI